MDIANLFQTINVVILLLTIGVGIYELRQSRKIHEQTLQWNKMNKTQEVMNNIRAENYPNSRTFFIGRTNGVTVPIPEILEGIDKNVELKSEIIGKLNSMEGLARGIKLGLYDENIVKLSRKTAMIQIFDEWKEFIDYRRLRSNAKAWFNSEELINRWR